MWPGKPEIFTFWSITGKGCPLSTMKTLVPSRAETFLELHSCLAGELPQESLAPSPGHPPNHRPVELIGLSAKHRLAVIPT